MQGLKAKADADLARLISRLSRRFTPSPPALVPTEAEVDAVRFLVSGTTESADRRRIVSILERFLAGEDAALRELTPHAISLADHRAQDISLMNRMEARLEASDDPFEMSVLAGLRIQMRRWDGALEVLDRLAQMRRLTAVEAFLSFQVARIEGRRDRLETYDDRPLSTLADAVPEVRADLAARNLTMGRPKAFVREIRRVQSHHAEAELLARMSERLRELPVGETGIGPQFSHEDWARMVTVCSMRCSGGRAVQDFITDHSGVRASDKEYLALSGYMGFRSAYYSTRPVWRTIEFVRLHLLGLTVPVNRAGSRVMRQARADREAGLTPAIVAAANHALDEETTVRSFLYRLMLSVWSIYLDDDPGLLIMNKMFSDGRFDMFAVMPPLRCLMVWRDPRDQYAEQVASGFVGTGDVDRFVMNFTERVEALKAGLHAAGPDHRALFLNVGFEPFVTSETYRTNFREIMGLDKTGYAPVRFVPERSVANVGIWKNQITTAEARAVENALGPYMDTSAITLDLDGGL